MIAADKKISINTASIFPVGMIAIFMMLFFNKFYRSYNQDLQNILSKNQLSNVVKFGSPHPHCCICSFHRADFIQLRALSSINE
jgi:hypothetical protein